MANWLGIQKSSKQVKLLCHVLFLMLVLHPNVFATGGTMTGNGTEGDPYLVTDYTDLKAVGTTYELDKVYLLIADIDASPSASENSGAGFEPIGTESGAHFTGTFHGRGHVVKHLTINRPSTNGVGLFGWNNGTIDSLGVMDAYITGNYHDGCLVGANYGLVNFCYATGSVIGYKFAGCLVGTNDEGGTVSDCYATGSVEASEGCAGGLVGYNIRNNSTVIRCYATGPVKDNSSNGAGGLVGYNSNGSLISESYATGYVTAPGRVGGLVGWNSNCTTNTSFWNTETSGQSSGCGDNEGSFSATGLTTAQMKNSSNFSGWNFSSIWTIRMDSTYPGLQVIDNAPFAFADTLSTGRTFLLSQLFQNDCDIETIHNNLTLRVISASRGITDSISVLTFPDSIASRAVSSLNYRIGEIRSADTLWGNIAVAIVMLIDPPTITSFTPIHNALNAEKDGNITVTFSQDIDETTLSNSTVRISGSLSGPRTSAFSYDPGTHTATIDPGMDFKVGDVVNVMLTRGIRSTVGDSLLTAYSWSFTVKVNTVSSGTFTQTLAPGCGLSPRSVKAGDFDGDGDIDLVTANLSSNTVSILLNNGSGTFTENSTPEAGGSLYSVTAGDFDGDGDLDLAVVSRGGYVSILLNDGSGTFTKTSMPGVGNDPFSVTTGDFDGDGDIDLATANFTPSTVSILLNNGNGTFTNTSTTSTSGSGTLPQSITSGDFDGDGDLDLAVANSSGITVSILLNNGSGTFTLSSTPEVGSNQYSVTSGDFDGDGDLDLATANCGSSCVSILLNDGSGTFTHSSTPNVESSPQSVTVGDYDGDGDLDLATSNYNSNTVSILLNNGSGTFTESSTPGVGSEPYSVAAGDFDGDGDLDLAAANLGSNTVSIMKNVPTAPIGLIVTDSSSHTIALRWHRNMESTFLRYYIYGDTISNPTAKIDSTTGGIDDTSKVFTGLTNGMKYYFHVTAVDNTNNESDFSNEVSATPVDIVPPNLPQNLVVTDSSSQTITIIWQKNAEPDFMLYRIYRDITPNPIIKVDSMMGGITDTAKTFVGLVNGMRYYFRVTAVDSVGNESEFSSEVNAVPADRIAPAVPQNLTVTDSLNETISIEWEKNIDEDFMLYRIYRDTSTNPVTKIDSTIGGISDTTKVYNGLSVGTRYYFRVTAVDSAGNESGYSNEVNAIPQTTITFIDGSWYTAPNAVSNTNDNPVGRFKLKANASGAKLVSVNVTFSGSFSGVTYVKLCSSADSIFGGDLKLDSIAYSGSPITLNGIPSAIDTSGTYYFVMIDLGVSSGTIAATIADNADITLSAGILIGTISNAPLAGNSAIITSVDNEEQSVPRVFALNQNYPNPFNPTTTITFTLAENSYVSLKVFDIIGREVITLFDGQLNAGVVHHAILDASRLSSGMYFYRLEAGENVQVKKLMLLK